MSPSGTCVSPGERAAAWRKGLNSLAPLARRFRHPWSGVVPSGESVNPGGWEMADETPKAPEPELSIAPDAEAKRPARPRNLYAFVKQAWKSPRTGVVKETHFQRMVEWRRGNAFVRVERPTRIDRARELGYRAKQGYVVVRARVRRGGRRRPRPMGGRHPKRRGLVKITMAKSIQRIAEERTAKHYPNMEILNSYWVGEDGMHKYYEVILVDPNHPAIRNDPKINWICNPANRGRVFRGRRPRGRRAAGSCTRAKAPRRSGPASARTIARASERHADSIWVARRPTSSSESPMTGSNKGTSRPTRSPGSNEAHRVPRNTASARVIFTNSARRPSGGKSRTFRRTSHRRRGSTSGSPGAVATAIRQPRFIPIHAATMPSRFLTTARPRPWLPRGSPPGPGQISRNTNARFWRTSMWISISGWDRFTRTPGWARRTTSPSSRARSWLVNGWVPTRRVRSANVFPAARDHFASERTTCRSDGRAAWVSAAGAVDTAPDTRHRKEGARATSSA